MRKTALALLSLALLAGCNSEEPESAAKAGERAPNAPPKLAKIADQANQLLDGGVEAFSARLGELQGYPVVVNMWGSWCPPCRAEFPFFQKQALKRGAKVAFLGVNEQESKEAARKFLEKYPVPFPSYVDPDLKIATEAAGSVYFPITVFYNAKGKRTYVHQGGYSSEAKLVEDIKRYAL